MSCVAATVLQGPPGTGKTSTIVALINLLLFRAKQRILVCTPSNAAVDEVRALRVSRVEGPFTIDFRGGHFLEWEGVRS